MAETDERGQHPEASPEPSSEGAPGDAEEREPEAGDPEEPEAGDPEEPGAGDSERPEPEAASGRPGAHDDFNVAERELCPDEACIGLIGPDGRCKECGTVGRSAVEHPRNRGLRSEEEVAEEVESHRTVSSLDPPPGDFDDRELCPDGACIGLIGADGRCRECGTPASGRG